MPFDPDKEVEAAELRAAIDEIGAGAPPRGIRSMNVLAALFAAASLICTGMLIAETVASIIGRPIAFGLAVTAVGCGVAAAVSRRVHARLAGPLTLLSQALESAANAHLILGPDGRTAYANAAFLQYFGRLEGRPLAAIGRRVSVADGSDREFARLIDEAARRGLASGRIALLAPDGRLRWYAVSANRLPRRPGFMLWSFEDVTTRHTSEQVILDEQSRLTDFLDHAPIGFYSVDGNGRFLFANRALAEWLGTTPEELVGEGARLSDFLARPASHKAPPHAPFAGAESEERGSLVLRNREGRTLYAHVTQSVLRSGDGLRTRSVLRDLSPEREWQEALRLSRQRFQNFFADAPVGIALLDAEGRLEEANEALGRLLETPPATLIGKSLPSFLDEEDRAELMSALATVMKGGPFERPLEVRLRGTLGHRASVFMSRLGAGEAEGGLMLHFIDTTEQKNLQAQFAQSQKMQAVGQLAGGVAHDFNNLLTAIIGFCDLLLLRFGPRDEAFGEIKQIEQNAKRAANLVRQLLAFSRQQTLQPRVINITDVLAELSHLLRRLIGENITLEVVHARDLGLVKVDQGQLEQVIINLAVNARDAMPRGGALTIRTANVTPETPIRDGREVMPPGHYVEVEVVDTGKGIPAENLERIFDPFFTTKEIGSGTGLGLSTVYGIVKQTGGFVFVASEPGRGAIFSIYLPRHQGVEAGAGGQVRAEAAETRETRDLTGAGTVMLVEDETPVRLFSARALGKMGYKVIEATSGESALEMIATGGVRVNLLITDVVMPGMDGPSLIKEVRGLHPEMKVIFISGYAEDSFRKRLGDDRDIHFLPKPFSLKQLAGKVKEVMAANAA